MLIDPEISVVITMKKSIFYAESPNFPDCLGVGKKREEALEMLAAKIASSISEGVQQVLSDTFKESAPIQLRVSSKRPYVTQHMTYNLLPPKSQVPVSKIPQDLLDTITDMMEQHHGIKLSKDDFESVIVEEIPISSVRMVQEAPKKAGRFEDFGFGIPFSLN